MHTDNARKKVKPYGKVRRLVCWILAFTMIFGLLPASSLFADFTQESGGAGSANGASSARAARATGTTRTTRAAHAERDTNAPSSAQNKNDGAKAPARVINLDAAEVISEADGDGAKAGDSPGAASADPQGDIALGDAGNIGGAGGSDAAGATGDEGGAAEAGATGEPGVAGETVNTALDVVAGSTNDENDANDANDANDTDTNDPNVANNTNDTNDTDAAENTDEDIDAAGSGGEVLAPGDLYRIRFYVEGVEYTSQFVREGEYARFPGAPDRMLFPSWAVSFLGWYETGASDDEPHSFATPIMANLDLSARFSDMYLVQFLDGFNNVYISERVAANDNATEPTQAQIDAIPLPPNTYLSYWTIDSTAPYSEYIFGATPITDDTVFRPVLLEGIYVHFISYGSEVPAVLVKPGERVSAPSPLPTRLHYTFLHWTTEPGGTGTEYDFMAPVDSSLTLYASWVGDFESVPYRIVWWLETPNLGAGVDPVPGVAEHYDFAFEETKMGTPGTEVNVNTLPDLAYNGVRPVDINNPLYYAEFQYCADTLVSGVGNTVVNVYLTRKTYRVTFDLGHPDQWLRYIGSTDDYYGDELYIDFKYEQDISNIWPSRMTAEFSDGLNGSVLMPFHSWIIPTTINGFLDSYDVDNDVVNWLTRRNVFSSDMLPKDPSVSGYTMKAYYDNIDVLNARYWLEPYVGQSLAGLTTRTYASKTYILDTQYNQDNVVKLNSGKDINGVSYIGADYSMTETGSAATVWTDQTYQNFYYDRMRHNLIYNTGVGDPIATVPGLMFGQPLADYMPTPDPVKDGYNFMGWFKDSLSTLAFDFSTAEMPANTNLIVFAKWESTDHTVTFYDDTDVLGTQGVATGFPVNFNNLWFNGLLYDSSLFVDGKGTFLGWQYYPPGSSVLSPFPVDLLVYNDINLYVRWRTDGYKVTYSDDGAAAGSVVPVDNNEYKIGTYARALAGSMLPPDAGDTFLGWRTQTGTITYYPDSFIPITGDMLMFPRFVGGSSLTRIIYDNNYPSAPQTRPIVVEQNSQVPLTNETIFTSVPPNQSFLGWQEVPGVDPILPAYSIYNIGVNEVTLYAVWASNTVILTYDGNGDMDATSIPKPDIPRNTIYDVLGNAPTGLRMLGHEHIGWTTKRDDSTTLITSTVYITEDMTVYALWSDYLVYKELTFDGNGDLDDTEESIFVLIHDEVNLNTRGPQGLVKLGYDHDGWSLVPDDESTKAVTLQVSQDITVYAFWGDGPLYVTITYYGNGDTDNTVKPVQVLKHSTVTLADDEPTGLNKAGFVFDGWTLVPDDDTTAVTVLTRVAVNTPVYAYWNDAPRSDTPNIDPIMAGDQLVTGQGVPGASIEVTWPGAAGLTTTVTVNAQRNWSALVPAGVNLVIGDIVYAVQTESGKMPSLPAQETVGGVPVVKSDTPDIDIIYEGDPAVTGRGVPGSTISVLFKGNQTVTATVAQNGTWSVTPPSALVRDDLVFARQKTGSYEVSDWAQSTVRVRPTQDTSDTPNINPIKAGATVVTGEGVPGAEIEVVWPDNKGSATAIVGSNGNWSVAVPASVALASGDIVTAYQTETGKLRSLPAYETVEGDLVEYSDTPDIDEIYEGDKVITGNGEPGSLIRVRLPGPGGRTVDTTVDANGRWSVDVPVDIALVEGDEVFAQQLTTGFEPSEWAQRTVIKRPVQLISDTPNIDPITVGDLQVTGQGVPNAKIEISWPNNYAGNPTVVYVRGSGNWAVNVPAAVTLVAGQIVTAVQTEAGKLPSEPATEAVNGLLTGKSDTPDINVIYDDDTAITGRGIADSLVNVKFPDNTVVGTTVNSLGLWQVAVPAHITLEVGDIIYAQQKTGTNEPSEWAQRSVIARPGMERSDTPNINPIHVADKTVTGEGIPNATIVVTWPGGATVSTTVGPRGNWSVAVPAAGLAAGQIVSAVQTESGKLPSWPAHEVVIGAPPIDGDSDTPDIDVIYENDTTISGWGIAGSAIVVRFKDGRTADATVLANGRWSVSVLPGITLVVGDIVEAMQRTLAYNPSEWAQSTVRARIPLPIYSDTPNINPINAGDRTVTGEGVPGAEIEITWPGSGVKTSGIVDPNGNWTIAVPAGVNLVVNDIVSAIQKEPGKLPSTPAHATVGGADKPGDNKSDTPNIDDIIAGDRIVSGNGEPGSEIIVRFKNGLVVRTTVQPNRLWSVDVPDGLDLEEGDIVLAVQVTGNKLPSDEAQRTVLGAPRPIRSDTPNIDPVKDTDKKVTGKGVPGAKIVVTWPGAGNQTTTTTVDPEGFWSVDVPPTVTLNEGDIITAIQTEPGKPDSLPAHETVNGDTKTGPGNDKKSDTPDIDEIFVGATVVTGSGTPGSEVIVKFRNGKTVRVIVGQDGKWSVDVPDGLAMREGDIVFAQQLTEGKEPSDWAQRTVIAHRAPSAVPTVNPVTEDDTEVTGKGVPDAKITVIWPDGTTGSTIVDKNGNWRIDIPDTLVLKEGDKISVYQTEPGKGPSAQVDVYVQRRAATPSPTPTPIPPTPTAGNGGPGSPGSGTGGGHPPTPKPTAQIKDEEPPITGFIAQHIQYIKGYPEGTVRADSAITRAETAEIIYRLLEASLSGRRLTSPFPDVGANDWFGESVAYLASINILKGYLDGTFRPDNPISRAEFATMISGFDHLEVVDYNVFPDVEGHWAVGYINSAAEKGWVAGYLDGSFKPEDHITRAEVISVVNRMLNRKIRPANIPSWAPSYTDLTTTHWAYADIIEASIGHEYERQTDGFELWTDRLNR